MEFTDLNGAKYNKPSTKANQTDYMTTYFHEQRQRELELLSLLGSMAEDNKEMINLLRQINSKRLVKSTFSWRSFFQKIFLF